MAWAVLLSCAVHGLLLLQNILYKSSPSLPDSSKVLEVRWIAPQPPAQPIKTTVNAVGAISSRLHAPYSQVSSSTSLQAGISFAAPQAQLGPGPSDHIAFQASPSIAPTASQPTDADTSIEPSATQQTHPLDLSQASLARAARQANAPSLAHKARLHTGLEPETRARVFAKHMAATALPSCWSHTQDGEGQPLVAPSGNLLLLPLAARDAVSGKCKVTP